MPSGRAERTKKSELNLVKTQARAHAQSQHGELGKVLLEQHTFLELGQAKEETHQ